MKKILLILILFVSSFIYSQSLEELDRFRQQQVNDQTSGIEYITNGTFDSDITGWTATIGVFDTLAWNTGELDMETLDATLRRLSYTISTDLEANETYNISFDYNITTGTLEAGTVYVRVNTTNYGSPLNLTGTGTSSFNITTTSTGTSYFRIDQSSAVDVLLDNISVKKVQE